MKIKLTERTEMVIDLDISEEDLLDAIDDDNYASLKSMGQIIQTQTVYDVLEEQ
jgi:hypothetical protein|tara:strand:- start:727 stop:888 length:162 start_codon:yes stop_codon:yes gene_type:complete